MLGVHGRREFNPMPQQWEPGDIIQVGVMCPSGHLSEKAPSSVVLLLVVRPGASSGVLCS